MKLVLDHTAVEPGGVFTGTIEDAPAGEQVVTLSWHTDGKGERDHAHVTRVLVANGERFSLQAPDAPWSCRGRLLSIRYEITVERSVREPVIVAPGGEECVLA